MALVSIYNKSTMLEAQRAEGYDVGSMGEFARNHALIDNIPFFVANKGDHNRQVQVDRLPTPSWGQLNGSIATGAGGRSSIDEPVKFMQLESQVDVRQMQAMAPEIARAYRDSEDEIIMEACMAGAESALFYGNDGSSPDTIRGFSQRRASLGTYCIGAGGSTSGSMMSAYLIQPGKLGVHFIYSPGSQPGIRNQDMGKQRVASADGNGDFYAFCRLFEFWGGIVIRDNRSLVRFPNIISGHPLTANLVIQALNNMRNGGAGSILVVPREVKTELDQAVLDKSNAAVSFSEIEGYGRVTHVVGVPIALSDDLLSNEATVS